MKRNIALLGNPNVGKTSLFNRITGLRQKVGNYPGITVEKREGTIHRNGHKYHIIDLPGTYSIYPSSVDEQVVFDVLSNKKSTLYPDLVVVVADPATLKRGIMLYQQVREMGIPAIFAVNMADEMKQKGLDIDVVALEHYLKTNVYLTNARTGSGVTGLVKAFNDHPKAYFGTFRIPVEYRKAVDSAKRVFPLLTEYQTWQHLAQDNLEMHTAEERRQIAEIRQSFDFSPKALQKQESLSRGEEIEKALTGILRKGINTTVASTTKLDRLLLHPILGYLIFIVALLLVFQAIYSWSAPLMDSIDAFFGWFTEYLKEKLPEGALTSILTDGIIAGIGGIVIFVPQIAILFLLISLMEESGYMSRVVFLMDRWLKPFGLNGKSIIPLVSGVACAIPAVMSARNIEDQKERLLTMLVTPFTTCSARLPIYVVLIGLVIPEGDFFGFNIQGLVLLGLYVLGFVMALLSAWILDKIIRSRHQTFLIFELPTYKTPDWKNVGINVWEKVSGFLFNAGKIILSISIILWVLGSFGPNDRFSDAESYVGLERPELEGDELANEVASYQLEHSFLGYIGRAIEPVVRPLGYDWKMGIGLLSSFAAREAFVGTMAVVYSLGEDVDVEDDVQKGSLLAKMRNEVNRNTGQLAYNLASGISLLLFYAFAMQCMATIAVVRKETGSWKWTFVQWLFMTGLAYIVAFFAYQLLK